MFACTEADTVAPKAGTLFSCVKSQDKTKKTYTVIGFSLSEWQYFLHLALWLNNSGDGDVVNEKHLL